MKAQVWTNRSWELFVALALITTIPFLASQSALAQFTQGPKLVATDAIGNASQGNSVALSADGHTAIVGGFSDNGRIGAAWIYNRNGGAWHDHGIKLVGMGAVGTSLQGMSVALSADGNTAIVGAPGDNDNTGAVWIFTRSHQGGSGFRSNKVWAQQGNKLVGSGTAGKIGPFENSMQGYSVALSADGNTAIVGGVNDNKGVGAAWIFTRSNGVWTQQGNKLVGTGASDAAYQGGSVALSADGNTAIVGGGNDGFAHGAAWIFTRTGGVWAQQGNKLRGADAIGFSNQGKSVALSADGNTAIVGGGSDNNGTGAAWIFARNADSWVQQGSKLVAVDASGVPHRGYSVAMSANGNTAILGGFGDNGGVGAAWIYTRSGSVWTQQGSKLVGSGAAGASNQGYAVALSGDGNTAILGGVNDGFGVGAAWIFVQPTLRVFSGANITASGTFGQTFSPSSFDYQISSTSGSLNYSISGIPSWLNVSFISGTATTSPATVTFSLSNLNSLSTGTYTAIITFANSSTGLGTTTRKATLIVNPNTAATLYISPDTQIGCKDEGWLSLVQNQYRCGSSSHRASGAWD